MSVATPAPITHDRYRYVCRQCGCYWRNNPDGTWSLYDAARKPKACCDNAPDLPSKLRRAPTPGIPFPMQTDYVGSNLESYPYARSTSGDGSERLASDFEIRLVERAKRWPWPFLAGVIIGAIVLAVVGAIHGCSAPQRAAESHALAVVVEVARDAAKAVCVAVETPGVAEAAAIVVPSVATPLAVSTARLVCAAFVDGASGVRVFSDGTVAPVASVPPGELRPVLVYQ